MYSSAGLSTTGSNSFGMALVAGRKRVPRPAAGITALVTGMSADYSAWAHQPGNAAAPRGIARLLGLRAPSGARTPRRGLCRALLAVPEIGSARVVTGYVALRGEPDIGPALDALRTRGVRCCCRRCSRIGTWNFASTAAIASSRLEEADVVWCRQSRPIALDTGWDAGVARTTGRWAALGRARSSSPSCMRTSCWSPCLTRRTTSGWARCWPGPS